MAQTMRAVLYHNPRCSKSREALALLREHAVEHEIIEYLKTPPTKQEIEALAAKLGGQPSALLRPKEEPYAALGLSPDSSLDEVASAIATHPILLERPILVVGARAVIGRPSERLLELL